MGLKHFLESIEHKFEPGGKYERWYSLYEAVATIAYTPGSTTQTSTHAKDNIDLNYLSKSIFHIWVRFSFFDSIKLRRYKHIKENK